MSALVELQYNPYLPQLSILINGTPPSDLSRLIQYSDEDIWQWADEIMDAIYAEIREKFAVFFTGMPYDADVIHIACEKCPYCIGFRSKEFLISEPLQKRMGRLNQLIRNACITSYEKTVIDAIFVISPVFQEYQNDILSIDINNLFCSVKVQIADYKFLFEDREDSVLFILAEDSATGYEYLKKIKDKKIAFIIIPGNCNRIIDISKQGWVVETTQSNLLNTVFNCFIQIPLTSAFRKCIGSINGGNKIGRELGRISCVESLINIIVEREVEVGRSIKLTVDMEPPTEHIPELVYKVQSPQIASCDGINVYGLREGICLLEVYKSGVKKPFFTKKIQVYKRNRINKLVLSEDSLLTGINDRGKIECDYFPVDADNADTISWQSSDPDVIQVDADGSIYAMKAGTCRIICTAENVSAQCFCTVKPYMEDIQINIDLGKNGVLHMESMQEILLDIICIPTDCVDSRLLLSTSDSDIVNVVNHTLYAKKKGRAIITVRNLSGRVSRCFTVEGSKKTRQKGKMGLMKSLFK